jgi:acyl-CoA synthetase (AMP-forming)/AMP-acid ligase II
VAAVATSRPVDPAELIELVAGRLASYKRPSHVVLVTEIPRLPSGKALRRTLKEQWLAR